MDKPAKTNPPFKVQTCWIPTLTPGRYLRINMITEVMPEDGNLDTTLETTTATDFCTAMHLSPLSNVTFDHPY